MTDGWDRLAMGMISPVGGLDNRRNVALEGEHPAVVVADIAQRTRPRSHIIAVANEKGGVGKSTLALHIAVALAHAGRRVLAVDLDRRQQTLGRALAARDATARRLKVTLPLPRHVQLQHLTGAMLCQEIARSGWNSEFVVIDSPGHDSPIARRAVALADQIVTPVNLSHADIEVIGRFGPGARQFQGAGCFAALIAELQDARVHAGLRRGEWLVVPNRYRHDGSRNHAEIMDKLALMAHRLGFRLAEGLKDRVAYRDLLALGLTQLDLGCIPNLPRSRSAAGAELQRLVAAIVGSTPAGQAMTGPPMPELAFA